MGKRFTIYCLVTCPYVFPRGKSLRVHAGLQALLALGHRITVFTYANGSDFSHAGLEIRRTPYLFRMRRPGQVGPCLSKIFSDSCLYRLAYQAMKDRPCDLLLATDIEGAILATLLKRSFSVPVLMDIHGIFSELLTNTTRLKSRAVATVCNAIERWAWSSADLLLCNWPRVRAYARKILPDVASCTLLDIPPESVQKIIGQPFPATSLAREWQERLNGRKVLLYTGNFSGYNHFSLALEGFSLALKNGLERVIFLVVGGGDQRAQQRAVELNLGDNVFFLGRRSPEEAMDMTRLSDVCLSMTTGQGNTPSKILYYFLAGKPVILCDSKPHRSFVPEETDALYCANRAEDLAAKLILIFKSHKLRRNLSEAVLRKSREYTVQATRDQWQQILQTLLVGSPK